MHRIKYLFTQYTSGNCSREELEELFLYIRDSEHDEELRSLIRGLFEDIKLSQPSLIFIDPSGNFVKADKQKEDKPRMHPIRRIKPRWFIAAAFLLVLVSSGWLLTNTNKTIAVASVKTEAKKYTERTEQKHLVLSDGTQVWLNAASSLQFPEKFEGAVREVYLTGEAYFDVMHADKVPFIIHTKNVTTTVLGTAFNIKAYPNQKNIVVSVTRGKVRVEKDEKVVALLTKGHEVKINQITEQVEQKDVAVEKVATWQQGKLRYDEMYVDDIVKDLQNVYNVEIDIKDTAVQHLNITTSFDRSIGAQQALSIIGNLVDKKVKEKNGVLVVE